MSKLLAWGDGLFLVRCELGKLQLQRVVVDVGEKKASLRPCNVQNEAVLPADALLVAANEVEDTHLAIRYPVLVLQTSQEVDVSVRSSTSRKRRRSKDHDNDTAALPKPRGRLFFCILNEMEGEDNIGFQLLNILEIPGQLPGAVTGEDSSSLQVFLTDGPYVLLFKRSSQWTTVLKLQRAGDLGFEVWFERGDVIHDTTGEDSAPFDLVSCVYASEAHSSRPHLLIHAQQTARSPDGSEKHQWRTLDLREETSKGNSSQCRYLCCNTAKTSETALSPWDYEPNTGSSRPDLLESTLLVTGTTSNSIYVLSNGITIASYVLPARPAEIWCMGENSFNQRHVLCVRCDDVNRSFFILEFSSLSMSMELLLSFNHVGHAHTGHFADIHTFDTSSSQVLLLNDVPGIFGLSTCQVSSEATSVEDGQLVKRSVLITQKESVSETKLSCHRLRLREVKQSSSSRKRTRKDAKSGSKGDPGGHKPEAFCYIERTQKTSSRDKSASQKDEEMEGNSTASQSQLGKLANSLSTCLSNGLQELERLQMVVGDKCSLAHQLNKLIVRQWQKQHSRIDEKNLLMPLISTQEDLNLHLDSEGHLSMETIVSTPRIAVEDRATKDSLKLEEKVSLERFRVLEYVPLLSLVRAEVVLKNASETNLNDSFVMLTARKGRSQQGWKCSCSVVPEYSGTVRFCLELQFAPSCSFLRDRKPLELTLWLHWGQDHSLSLDWRPSELALAVATIKIHPNDMLNVGRESSTNDVKWSRNESSNPPFGCCSHQEELLFISTGSNLELLLSQPSFGVSAAVDSVIRQTFALVNLNTSSRELMIYELSRMVANLPLDVYVMQNPLQQSHLRALGRVLRSMRREILAFKQQESKDDPASRHRSMQRDTDILVNQLLQKLQKRVNFHTLWFGRAG